MSDNIENESQMWLDKASEYLEKGDQYYHKAVEAILDAKAVNPKLTNEQIAKHLNKSTRWIYRLLKWHREGTEEIDWGNSERIARKDDLEDGIKKVSDEDLLDMVGEERLAKLTAKSSKAIKEFAKEVAKSDDTASEFAKNAKAVEKVKENDTWAKLIELARKRGGVKPDDLPEPSTTYPKDPLHFRSEVMHLTNKINKTAEELRLLWKDEAPLEEEEAFLVMARRRVAVAAKNMEDLANDLLGYTWKWEIEQDG